MKRYRIENTFTLGELELVSGVGNYAQATACAMSAAAAYHAMECGEPLLEPTDELECCCPVLRRLVIRRNDGPWKSDKERTKWGRLIIPRLINSRVSKEETIKRGYICADVSARRIAPIFFEKSGKDSLVRISEELRNLPSVVDLESANYAKDKLQKARGGAAAAADAAAAAAADAAAYSAAYAAADAAAAAYAYADAAAAAAAAAATYAAADTAAWREIDSLIDQFLAPAKSAPAKMFEREITLA